MRSNEAVAGRSPVRSRVVRDAMEFIRFSALGATVLIAMLGLVSAGKSVSIPTIGGVAAIALLFHVFAYVLNDVVDVDLDRTEPRRAEMPLVTGAISVGWALLIAASTIPMAAWILLAISPSATAGPAIASLAAAFVGLAAYDLAGKRTRWPPVTDLVQGLGWGGLLVAGAWIGGGPTPITAVLAAYAVVFILMANGVHGAVRDLPNDRLHGVTTTATVLGASVGPGGRRILSRGLMTYAWVLEGALIGLAGWALAIARPSSPFDPGPVLTGLLVIASVLLLVAASRRREAPEGLLRGHVGADADLLAAGMLHLMVGLGIPIALVASGTSPLVVMALTAGYLLPVLAQGWLDGAGRWAVQRARDAIAAIAPPARDLFLLTRPHNCLAAGLAVVVGARLGGASSLLAEPVFRAAAVASLVVAAANVANDRQDVVEDRINYPDRPIAAGRISTASADRFALILAAAGVLLAFTFGLLSASVVIALTLGSAAYSIWLKRTFLAGNILVAALAAATIPYGAVTLGGPTTAMTIGAALVFLSVLSSEVLISVLDREGDAVAGRTTIGTRLSLSAGLRLYVVLAAGLMGLVLAPPALGLAPAAFLWAGLVGVVLPNGLVLARLVGVEDARSVERAFPLSKIAWFTGLLTLAFLV